VDAGGPNEHVLDKGAHWRQRANTIEPSMAHLLFPLVSVSTQLNEFIFTSGSSSEELMRLPRSAVTLTTLSAAWSVVVDLISVTDVPINIDRRRKCQRRDVANTTKRRDISFISAPNDTST